MKKYLLLFCLTIFLTNLANAQWTLTTNGNHPNNIYCFSSDGSNIYTGCDFGVYISTDNGLTWNPTGLINKQIRGLVNSGSTIFAGTADNGVFKSSNNGASWTQVNSGLTDTLIISMAIDDNKIYATAYPHGYLYMSSNNGANWTLLNNGGPAVGFIAAKDTNIFAGSYYGLYYTTNNGSTWTHQTNNLPDSMFNSLAIEDNNIFLGMSYGVLQSTDFGSSWTSITGNMPSSAVRSFAIDSLNIFIGTELNGVYYSNNNGTSWSSLGLNSGSFWTEYLFINDSIILAGDSIGIWRRPIAPIISGLEYLQNTSSINIFPNPSSDIITIESSAINKDAKIFVYDIQGHLLLQRLLLQTKTDFNISQFAKGLYIIKFTNADKIEMRKFLKE